MQAIILAGGFGTRLQAVVKDVPKPMADISSKPFLVYLFQHLKSCGITKVVISVGYLQEKIIEYFGNSYLDIEISYAKEDKPLGTGGAIVNSLKFIDKNRPCFVVNGDSFLLVDYKKFFEFYQEKKSQLAIVLRKMNDCSRYGNVVFNEDCLITSFEEKSEQKKSGFINGGIYLFDPKIFEKFSLPEKFSFEVEFLMKYLQELQPQAFVTDEYFIDIGIPMDYQKAQDELPTLSKFFSNKNSHKNKALFLDRDGVVNIDHDHVFEIKKFDFVDGIFELCKKAQELGYLIIVVTNQAGIAKGLYSEEEFLELTKWVENEFAKRQIKIFKTFYCPYHIEAKIEKYCRDSFDRKPSIGMILKAINEFDIDVKKSVMIGDNETDILAAKKAGIARKIYFNKVKKIGNGLADEEIVDLSEVHFF